jgi:hypothetical protein
VNSFSLTAEAKRNINKQGFLVKAKRNVILKERRKESLRKTCLL